MPQSKVIQQGSTESMVFSMCAMNFVVAVTWTLYGYLVQDLYIQVPQLPVTVSPQAGTELAGRSVGTRRVTPICSVSHYLSLQYSVCIPNSCHITEEFRWLCPLLSHYSQVSGQEADQLQLHRCHVHLMLWMAAIL